MTGDAQGMTWALTASRGPCRVAENSPACAGCPTDGCTSQPAHIPEAAGEAEVQSNSVRTELTPDEQKMPLHSPMALAMLLSAVWRNSVPHNRLHQPTSTTPSDTTWCPLLHQQGGSNTRRIL